MQKIAIPFLFIVTLTIITEQQIANPNNVNVNFEGDFDSMNQISPTSQQKRPFTSQFIDDVEGEHEEEYKQQQKDMLEFAQHMADFLPDETFTFKMQPNQVEEFFLWPGAETNFVRGMFHSEVIGDDMDGYVNLAIFDGESLARSYKQQRLGIFNVRHNIKDHHYTFRFQNSDSQLEIYFSYEFTNSRKKDSYEPKNQSDIQRISREFQKVNRLLVQQETEMSRLVGISDRHKERIDDYLLSFAWSIVLETFLISFGNVASLIMLRRQIYAGYEMLV